MVHTCKFHGGGGCLEQEGLLRRARQTLGREMLLERRVLQSQLSGHAGCSARLSQLQGLSPAGPGETHLTETQTQ